MKKITIIITCVLLSMMLSLQAQSPAIISNEIPIDDVDVVDNKSSSDNEISRLERELSFYQLLVSPEVTVFDVAIDEADIPQCLQDHFAAIRMIVQMKERLEKVEGTIKQLTVIDTEGKQSIRESIEQDMIDLYDIYSEIKKLNLSTFSKEQKAYLKPGLTERYNTIYYNYCE